MEQQPLYTNDWFGLKTLNQAGRLKQTVVQGEGFSFQFTLIGVGHTDWLRVEAIFTKYLLPILN